MEGAEDTVMPTTKQYTENWEARAAEIKRLARYKCHMCKKQCYKPGQRVRTTKKVLTVHHINGDTMNDARANLMALCAPCHLIIEAMNRRLLKKWVADHTTVDGFTFKGTSK